MPGRECIQYLSLQSSRPIYDLSFIFSSSETVNLAEFGYNAEGAYQRLKRAGRTLIPSSVKADLQEIYEMYKSRNLVEDHFAAFKSLIQADKLYLRDATAVFGHVFVGFLCLYCRILNPDPEGRDDGAPVAAGAAPETLKGVHRGGMGGETDHRGAERGAEDRGEAGRKTFPDI